MSVNKIEPNDDIGTTEGRIRNLLGRLGWIAVLIVLVSALTATISFYLLQAKPLADADTLLRQQEATYQVSKKIDVLIQSIERVLLTAQNWSHEAMFGLDDTQGFNRLLIPVLKQHDIISNIYLARSDGRMIILFRTENGWKNYTTEVGKEGIRQNWSQWQDAHTKAGEDWKTDEYDPRTRPWYKGVMTVPENQVYWTEPYIFAADPKPGITASVRWTDEASGLDYVMSVDVLLLNVSRFTTHLSFGKNGQVALFTDDGRVLGLPKDKRFNSDPFFKSSILKTPEKIGLHILDAAWKQTKGEEGTHSIPADTINKNENWHADSKR